MALCEKIVIAGFSGAGKTSLLRELESKAPAGWERFDDLDQLVLKKHGQGHEDLASLIEEAGWETFRKWEREELDAWVTLPGRGVLSLGGGTLTQEALDSLKANERVRLCWLQTDFETCWRHLNESTEIRPLVRQGKAALHALYLEREKIFSQINFRLTPSQKVPPTFWE